MRIARELIDADADKVVRRLARHGYQAYLVGGCVRDLLLDRTPKDFDVATSATPKETKQLFRNCRIIGRRFRLCHIFFGPKIIETSTFRANPRRDDAADSDELLIRHDNVFGTDTEDAQRRDFTINGLFYDVEDERVIDHVGGLEDLASRVVRTIGDPDIRFREDPVRMLRAIKFAARLDFDIEPATYRAICRHRIEITKCAPPRVAEELYRLLRGGAARRSMELLLETGIAATLSPALAAMLGDEQHQDCGGAPIAPPADPETLDLDPEEASWHATWADEEQSWINGRGAHHVAARPLDLSFIDEPEELSDRQHQLWKVLDELDALFASGYEMSNSMLMAALANPFVAPNLIRSGVRPIEASEVALEVLEPLVSELRIGRRDAERARQILLAQRRLAPARRRRGKPAALVHREFFRDALAVYEMTARAADRDISDVAYWRKLLGEDGDAPGDELVEAGELDAAGEDLRGRKPRRRRRGGRRRRRTPDEETAAEHDPAIG
jgi:poly(A) polymerase